MSTVLLNLIHYVTALLSFAKHWLFRFQSLPFEKSDSSADARKLKKLPLHLGVLLLEDDISFADVASVILWSATMGITFISIYDTNGTIKRNHTQLAAEIQKKKANQTDTESINSDIRVHCGLNKPCTKHKGSSKVDVFLLSLDDGRRSVVDMAKHICHRVISMDLRPADITPHSLDVNFQENTGYPDPDMIIRFGQVESLLGFMPWHIRLSEILSIPSHIGIHYKTFKSVLVSYGDTNQRFGK